MRNVLTIIFCLFFIYDSYGQKKNELDNELAFGKLYGYVRYFHPSDEASNIDWDKFLIYGAKKVSGCGSQEELKQALTALFMPIAPTVKISDDNQPPEFDKTILIPSDLANYKTIAWQHLGIGLIDDKNSLYKSARTNRSITYSSSEPQFGTFGNSINAESYRGTLFKIRAKVKLAQDGGKGYLWIRVDKANKTMGFFDNMYNRPIVKKEWADYEIDGKINDDAGGISFGAILSGNGELWVDDYNLSVYKDGEWKTIFSKSFDDQPTGKATSGVLSGSKVAQPNPNYLVSIIQDDNYPSQKWVSIKTNRTENAEVHTSLFEKYPQVGEYTSANIGRNLFVIIPLALYGDSKNTFPLGDSISFFKLKKDIGNIKNEEMNGNDLYGRIADVINLWNVFQHFYPNFTDNATNWQADFRDALNKCYSDKDQNDFFLTLQLLTAKLNDGHIVVEQQGGNKDRFLPPISWEWIEDKLVITNVLTDSINLKKGDIVSSINGVDPGEYFKDAEKYISASTPGFLQYRANLQTLFGPPGSKLSVSVTRQETAVKTNVNLYRTLLYHDYNIKLPERDSIRVINDNVLYINLAKIHMKTISSLLPDMQKRKAIICDMRGYPTDDGYFIQYLMDKKDTAMHWLKIPRYIYPDRKEPVTYEESGWGLAPYPTHLAAKIILIVDAGDISYSESLISFIDHYHLATIIGQPTAGTNGNINQITLPGDYRITFTGMKVTKLDGAQFEGIGIKPSVMVQKTLDGIKQNRDEYLDRAIQIAVQAN